MIGPASQPRKSLDAVDAIGAGEVFDMGGARSGVTMAVYTTGGPTFSCQLQGSLDGTNWHDLGSAVTTAPGIVSESTHKVRYVRADLTAFSAGTTPTLTAWLAA